MDSRMDKEQQAMRCISTTTGEAGREANTGAMMEQVPPGAPAHPADRGRHGPATWGGSRRGRHERGTVLLMVVGVLALLSIVAVAYVAIGQADRRSSAALAREVRMDDQRDAIADYILGIIRDDVLAYEWQPPPSSPAPDYNVVRVRETWDHPHSNVGRYDPKPLSAPVGGTLANGRMPVLAGQYVIVSELQAGQNNQRLFDPAGLGDDPWLAPLLPTDWLEVTSGARAGAVQGYLNVQSWDHITNIAPTGQFVNLGTLRRTTENPEGNFYAAPGTLAPSAGAVDPAERSAQMSWGLWLYNDAGVPLDPATTTQPLADGSNGAANRNIPAHWSEFQRFSFRPINEPAYDNNARGPNSLRYLPYQWCDADGDGFADSRWFELSADVGTPTTSRAVPAIAFGGPARVFCAARIIDLSGLVNINVARDLDAAPDDANPLPLGLTPSDVDLRRLLRLIDAQDVYGTAYQQILQPPTGATTLADYRNYDQTIARDAGARGYDNIRVTIDGVAPAQPLPAPTAIDRALRYYSAGIDPSGIQADRYLAIPTFNPAPAFDDGDLLDLITFHGVNNPATLSRFERTVGGQYAPFPEMDPLRAPRPLSVERTNLAAATGTGRPSDAALRQTMIDVRRLFTPVSGERPLRSVALMTPQSVEALDEAAEVRTNLIAALARATLPGNAADPSDIFRAYANALMAPKGETGLSDAWTPGVGLHDKIQTLFYGGRGPELALRIAAHLTANLIDALDRDTAGNLTVSADNEKPRGYVLVQRQGTTPPPSGSLRTLNLDTVSGITTAADTRLAPASAPNTVAETVRVYGVEPQPFITQASMYIMYTDAHYDGSLTSPVSDPEERWTWTDTSGEGQVDANEIEPGVPTIKGAIPNLPGETNRDFLVQMFAVQLHNPFDEPVKLGDYILQFGQARWILPSGQTLDPGQTKVFYATNPGDEQLIKERWGSSHFPLAALPTVKAWRDAQLSIGTTAPTELAQRYELDGRALVQPSVVKDILMPSTAPDADLANRTVLLWRDMNNSPNILDDDVLADRLRDVVPIGGANRATLDRRLPPGENQINGAVAGADPRLPGADASEIEQNTGLTITLWGTLQRPIDPGAATATIPVGAIPAYCIEAKHQARAGATWGGLNIAEHDTGDPAGLRLGDFTGQKNANKTLQAALQDQSIAPAGTLVETMTKEPRLKAPTATAQVIRNNGDPVNDPAADRRPYTELYPEIYMNNRRGILTVTDANGRQVNIPTLRVGDVLLPLAIGPSWEPGVGVTATAPPIPTDANYLSRVDNEWTTLSEALALALDYDSPVNSDPRFSRFDRFGRDIVDRGGLKLDALVPYFDDNTNGQPDPGEIRAPGIPQGLAVLDQFNALDAGSLTTKVSGKINVNTAPPNVLRTMPLLAPPKEPGHWSASGLAGPGGGVAAPLFDQADNYDLAATLVAYRDKIATYTRPDTSSNYESISFEDSLGANPPDGRFQQTQIKGIHEGRGMRSVGEIMCLLRRDPAAPQQDLDNTIDRFAWDPYTFGEWAPSQSALGTDSTSYRRNAGNVSPRQVNGIVNDYQEQLTIANAVLNTLSVRSDVFCCWFVVHGYLPSDVEGLQPHDQMVPSYQRRYVMVVDRSNVVNRGDKPRILLLKELPM